MKHYFKVINCLLSLCLVTVLATSGLVLAASVDLATSPLATSTTSVVKPNILFVLDNSGSMSWTFMPDLANNFSNSYGYKSSQCNGVYYNPAITYSPPVTAANVPYSNASFTAARDNGFDTSSSARNLNTEFVADRYTPSGGATMTASGAFYYDYSGTVTTKDYDTTSSTFYTQCNTSLSSASSVFSKRRLASTETTTIVISGTFLAAGSVNGILVGTTEIMSSPINFTLLSSASATATSLASKITLGGFSATASGSTVTITGPTSAANKTPVISTTPVLSLLGTTFTTDVFPDTTAANLTNFANWYSFYRSRMLTMKTAAGQAFSSLNNTYRVGLMQISSSSSPLLGLGTFENTQRTNWYSQLYSATGSSRTPLREALSNAGRYYAGKLSGTDPVQYSCQQNFTILSTDGYWNDNDGFQLDGSTAVGNQDGNVARPMYDGYGVASQWTFTYTRNTYSKTTSSCSGGNKKLKTQPEIGSCIRSVSTGSCSPSNWSNNGASTLSSTCNKTAAPSTSTAVLQSVIEDTVGTGGSSDTLADVAMYYYKTDLRTPTLLNCGTVVSPATVGPLCENNVFISSSDNNLQQHMTTFTLGLGASGKMDYSSSYLSDSTGDYVSVKLGSVAHPTATPPVCKWQADGTTCNWPTPGSDLPENIDDLWHAAVNGRGAYFSATNPSTLSTGLSNALAGINARKGAAAAAATSTLNPVSGNNAAYVASYTTVEWKGNLEARSINTDTATVSENATWCVENVPAGTCATTPVAQTTGDTTIYNCETPATVTCAGGELGYTGNTTSGATYCKVPVAMSCTGTMNSKVADFTDTRTIKTPNSTGTALIDFDAAYATANPSYFNAAHIATLSQWTSLSATQQTAAANNLVNYLRGQYGYEDRTANAGPPDNRLFRYRAAVLGDALESQPAYISNPVFSYTYPGYSELAGSPTLSAGGYKTVQAGRAGTVYMGTNDGMMHAFAADTGIERWAYIPSVIITNMWKLADKNYASLHLNFVNGSPITSDVCVANCNDVATADWRTILVAGLNGGGRGYYALDITTPSTPTLLWEITTTAGIGKVKDADIGYSYGQPIITRKADGTWVVLVTSGYNNTSPGDGKGYLYTLNASTGAIISKIATGVGSTTTPSGLAKISGWNNEPAGNAVGYVYGGDLLGNVWRFNINGVSTAVTGTGDVMKLATLFSDSAGANSQPITTTPVLGKIAGKRVVFVGTGKYLETGDLTTTQIQTQYAIKDDDATTTLVNPRNTLVQQTLTNNSDGTATRVSSNNTVNFYTDRGWYVDLPESGERVNIDSALAQGVLVVPTIVPSNTACSPGGHGWLNFFNYKTGGAVDTATKLSSVKYDSTIVGINVLYVDTVPKVAVVTSTDPTPRVDDNVKFPVSAASFTGKRSLWRELMP